MTEIVKLDFKKINTSTDTTSLSHIDLGDQDNLKKIQKYVLPIIAENEGWGTADLTVEAFTKNPEKFQIDIDATLVGNVHILLDQESPVALLEYLIQTIDAPILNKRMSNLKRLTEDRSAWNYLLSKHIVENSAFNALFPKLRYYLNGKKICSEIGVVVRPDLQGQRKGYSQSLYELLPNGILFGWTSNPLIVSLRRKYFSKVLYFPLYEEKVQDLEGLSCLAILYADLLTYEESKWKSLKFGALNSPYFVKKRDSKYLELVDRLYESQKINKLDVERLKYLIKLDSVQGAIVGIR